MANIILKDVNKIYPNNVHAVYDFNIEIKDKEFIVFVGPSGCGKSTTLRMIAGLEEISTGEFYIDGKLMNYIQPKDRNVSMVFQNYALYPHMTVYKNMAYGLTINKNYLPTYEKDEKITQLLNDIKAYKREMTRLEKAMAKDADNQEAKAKYAELYSSIVNALETILSTRKPIIGLDSKRISRLTKEINDISKEVNYINSLIEQEKSLDDTDAELLEMYESDVANLSRNMNEKQTELDAIKDGSSEILAHRHLYGYEIDYEVYHAAQILDLDKYLSRFPNALSGGQRQRVALGRAIVRKPKVFLMDEPLSNLDAKLRVQTRGEISRLHKRVGATTIYVTHDQTEAMTLADRIVIMKDGYVQQIAEPMVAFNDPANMFVAGFIGSPSMNFITGTVSNGVFTSNDGNITLELADSDKEIITRNNTSDVVIGIRPEHIALSDSGTALEVDSIELLGDEFIIYTKTNEQNVTIKTNNPINPSLKGMVNFIFDNTKIYLFDPKTTNRIK